jgi:hypothetical protein
MGEGKIKWVESEDGLVAAVEVPPGVQVPSSGDVGWWCGQRTSQELLGEGWKRRDGIEAFSSLGGGMPL